VVTVPHGSSLAKTDAPGSSTCASRCALDPVALAGVVHAVLLSCTGNWCLPHTTDPAPHPGLAAQMCAAEQVWSQQHARVVWLVGEQRLVVELEHWCLLWLLGGAGRNL